MPGAVAEALNIDGSWIAGGEGQGPVGEDRRDLEPVVGADPAAGADLVVGGEGLGIGAAQGVLDHRDHHHLVSAEVRMLVAVAGGAPADDAALVGVHLDVGAQEDGDALGLGGHQRLPPLTGGSCSRRWRSTALLTRGPAASISSQMTSWRAPKVAESIWSA